MINWVKHILTYCKAIFRTRIICILLSEIKYVLYVRSHYGQTWQIPKEDAMDRRKCRKLIKAMRSECVWMSVCLVAAHPVHPGYKAIKRVVCCCTCWMLFVSSTVTERVKLTHRSHRPSQQLTLFVRQSLRADHWHVPGPSSEPHILETSLPAAAPAWLSALPSTYQQFSNGKSEMYTDTHGD